VAASPTCNSTRWRSWLRRRPSPSHRQRATRPTSRRRTSNSSIPRPCYSPSRPRHQRHARLRGCPSARPLVCPTRTRQSMTTFSRTRLRNRSTLTPLPLPLLLLLPRRNNVPQVPTNPRSRPQTKHNNRQQSAPPSAPSGLSKANPAHHRSASSSSTMPNLNQRPPPPQLSKAHWSLKAQLQLQLLLQLSHRQFFSNNKHNRWSR